MPHFISMPMAIALSLMASVTLAENIVIPPEVGADIVDLVSKYGLDPTGVQDATAKLNTALNSSPRNMQAFYLKNGTYKVTGTVSWPMGTETHGPVLIGQDREKTIIKLADGTWPLGTEKKHVLVTGANLNTHFRREIRNLTVNTGSNNAGAIGIAFWSSNQGILMDVNIISADGKGLVGLNLSNGGDQGPCMVRSVYIQGFETGIDCNGGNGVALSQITVSGQSKYGVFCTMGASAIDSLTSINSVKALIATRSAKVSVINASLTGGSPAEDAIYCGDNAKIFLRNIQTAGYRQALQAQSRTTTDYPRDAAITEYASHGGISLFSSNLSSLNLPVKVAPDPPWEPDPKKWAKAISYKTLNGQTVSDKIALQRAIDDPGKTTVLIGGKQFSISDTVYIRGGISRLIGFGAWFNSSGTVVITDDLTVPVVKLERWVSPPRIINRSSKTVIIESTLGNRMVAAGSGEMFINDYCGELEVTGSNQKVWARQFNAECCRYVEQNRNLTVRAGQVWISGWKGEGTATKATLLGGSTEVVNFTQRNNGWNRNMTGVPLFVIANPAIATFNLACQITFSSDQPYSTLVRETREGETRELLSSKNPLREQMSVFTAYGRQSDVRRPIARPSGGHAPRIRPHGRQVRIDPGAQPMGAIVLSDCRGRVLPVSQAKEGSLCAMTVSELHGGVYVISAASGWGALLVRTFSGQPASGVKRQ